MKQKPITLAIAALHILLFASCETKTDVNNPDNKLEFKEAFLEKVQTTKAILSDQEQELTLTGKVQYDPDKVINYVPMIGGIIDRSYFSLGDKVQKDQTLLDIRSTELTSLQSERVGLESDVKIAERELKTAKTMFDDNMLSEKELMEAQAKLNQARAAYSKVQTDMSVFGSNKGNGMFSIKAPMSGYIVAKNASSGSTVSADSDPLFVIADLSTVWVTVNVYAGNLLFVKEGQEVAITTLSYPGEVFKGKINTLSQVFDPEEKVLKARIVMPNKDLRLKPEMSVVVKLKNEIHNQLISVPSDALVFDNDRYHLVVEESPNNFVAKEVTLGGHHNKVTYIVSGISEGENIVTRNHLLIYASLKV